MLINLLLLATLASRCTANSNYDGALIPPSRQSLTSLNSSVAWFLTPLWALFSRHDIDLTTTFHDVTDGDQVSVSLYPCENCTTTDVSVTKQLYDSSVTNPDLVWARALTDALFAMTHGRLDIVDDLRRAEILLEALTGWIPRNLNCTSLATISSASMTLATTKDGNLQVILSTTPPETMTNRSYRTGGVHTLWASDNTFLISVIYTWEQWYDNCRSVTQLLKRL